MGDAARDAHRLANEDGPVRRASALLLSAALPAAALPLPALAQTWRTLTSSRQVHGEAELAVDIRYASGRFTLAAGEPGTLYRMELQYDEDRFTPIRSYDAATGSLQLGTRSRGPVRGGRSRGQPAPFLDVALTPAVPVALSIETGAAASDLDLGSLSIRSLTMRTGASETRLRFSVPNHEDCSLMRFQAGAAEFRAQGLGNANCRELRFEGGVGEVELDFSGEWLQSMDADIDLGIGELTLYLPREVGVSVRINRFLTAFSSAGLVRRGNAYYSENWDRARTRLVLNVDATLGEVAVRWLDR